MRKCCPLPTPYLLLPFPAVRITLHWCLLLPLVQIVTRNVAYTKISRFEKVASAHSMHPVVTLQGGELARKSWPKSHNSKEVLSKRGVTRTSPIQTRRNFQERRKHTHATQCGDLQCSSEALLNRCFQTIFEEPHRVPESELRVSYDSFHF